MARRISARFPGGRWRLAGAGLKGGLLAAVCLGAVACGYFGGSGASSSPPKAQAPQPPDPAARALAGMVDAVGPSRAHVPVELRFSIHDRPEVGAEDEIDYALIPKVGGVDSIHLVFGALEGLEVIDRGPKLAAVKPASGVPIFGSVMIRPVKTGLFTLTVAVGVQSPNGLVVWPFRIPIITGEAPAEAAANQP